MKLTKKQQTWKNLDMDKVYTLSDAIDALREYTSKKFDETLEIAIRLGIDVTKADQNIRGMLSLPNGTGKSCATNWSCVGCCWCKYRRILQTV